MASLRPFVLGVFVGGTLAWGAAATETEASPQLTLPLSKAHEEWLDLVDPIISGDERAYFLGLEETFRRQAFVEAFWRVRDPHDDTHENEFRVHWEGRGREATFRFGTMKDARAVAFTRHGEPDYRCVAHNHHFEVWRHYEGDPERFLRDESKYFYMLFYAAIRDEPYRRWLPGKIYRAVNRSELPDVAIRDHCRGDAAGAMGVVRAQEARDPLKTEPDTWMSLEPPVPPEEWLPTFVANTSELPEGAEVFEADLEYSFPGRQGQRTVVQAVIAIDPEDLQSSAVAETTAFGPEERRFVLVGEVVREDELFETFQFRFNTGRSDVATASDVLETPAGQPIGIVFQRLLRPGTFRVLVRLEDLLGRSFTRFDRTIEVPQVEESLPAPSTLLGRYLAEADAATARGETTLTLLPPSGVLHTGPVRFQTLTTGELDRVEFLLDDRLILTKTRPPYSVELHLGDFPEPHTLRAVAFDIEGRDAASDELLLNPGGQTFRVRLAEPRNGERYEDSLRASVQVSVPDDRRLDRVELYLADDLVATLYQAPFYQPILLPHSEATYVRAVAHLTDGHSTEDLAVINAPGVVEDVDVQMVEVFATVRDRRDDPVTDLRAENFRILEDGEPQQILRFRRVTDLPLHALLLLDVSASMKDTLPRVAEAGRGFLEGVMTPKDRASVVSFHDQPTVAESFSSDIDELVRELESLRAAGSTALYDSIVFSLHYFYGIKGQKALLVLSDGDDEASRFDVDTTLEVARRSGIQIYAIGLQEEKLARVSRRVLRRLAEESGGRAFFPDSADELPAIYRRIQDDLRSQYFLTYQSNSTQPPTSFRRVEVAVEDKGRGELEVRAMSGYYP
ncbi:MAG: VWA domain-containing protein [Thermoanaerobaculia bacterium]|nr:VWA domain-containing protein [Thermoanaerobaculia bacterium]